MIKIGEQIPDVEVEAFHDDEVQRVRLSAYRGRWLLVLFYPADFTFRSPTELAQAAHHYEEFVADGVQMVSVSTDTVSTHRAWHESSPMGRVQFPMLADPTGALCRAFGTYLEDAGVSLRATFLVDADGVLVAGGLHANNIGRTLAEMLRKRKPATSVRAREGRVCRANWRPGHDTLRPFLDRVCQPVANQTT